MILYIENPKESTHTHTQTKRIIAYNKQVQQGQRKKFKKQKSVVLLYTNNEQYENEIKKTIAFTIVAKRINLTEDV